MGKSKSTLFLRISLRLIFPLCLLISAFTAIQLTNQLDFLNRVYEIQSRIALQGMTSALDEALQNPSHFENALLLKAELNKAQEANRVAELLLLDPLTRDILYSKPEVPLTPRDLMAAEQALIDKKEGKPTVLFIDKETEKLFAFLPITSSIQQRVYVAKLGFPLGSLQQALQKSVGTLIAMFFFTLLAGLLIAGALSHSIVKPIQTLNQATRIMVRGELGQKVAIYTGDEIEELADTFNQMSVALKEMKERAEDANPLTGLPGNHGIYFETQKRIYEKQKFVFFHIDLDRFKIFNDHYGLARGDEVIRKTSKLLRETLNEKGGADDFLGHQGGDDFVIITQPARAQEIAETVIQKFDGLVKTLYRKEDYELGYIMAEDRRAPEVPGVEQPLVKYPLLAISLAGISNIRRDFGDYFDLLSRAVNVKKEVKATVESCYQIVE
jgi:diguanylate cyclase (GGDEF)-like protein